MLIVNRTLLSAFNGNSFGTGIYNDFGFQKNRVAFCIGFGNGDQMESIPGGFDTIYAIQMAIKSGGMASHNIVNAESEIISSELAKAINIIAAMDGGSIILALLGGITPVIASISATSSLSADLEAKLIAILTSALSSGSSFNSLLGAIVDIYAECLAVCSISASVLVLSGFFADIKNYTELSSNGVADAVWNALSTQFNKPGTMGNKVNSAAASGDPWTADLPGTYAVGSAGEILGNLVSAIGSRMVENGLSQDEVSRIMLAALSGVSSGVGTNNELYKSNDGLKNRIDVLFDTNGNRTDVILDGSI